MNKKKYDKLIVIFTIILFFALFYFCVNLWGLLDYKKVQAVTTSNDEKLEVLENKNPIDIDKLIEKNKNIDIREEMIYEKQDLEYTTEYKNNDKLPSGTIHVSQLGITGSQDVITIKKYEGDELISEQIVASNIIIAPINKVVEIGTGRRKK